MEGCCVKSEISPFSRLSRFSRKLRNSQMSFLEITKLHRARQEVEKSVSTAMALDGRLISRIIWKSETVIVFQDPDGHFWRHLVLSRRSERALIKTKSN